RKGKLEEWQFTALKDRCMNMLKDKIFLDDTPALNIFGFRTKVRRLVMKHNVGLVIIDYLQLMSGSEEGKGNREQEISKISRQLKTLAKELRVPIIALSQLSRDVEKRGKQEPQLSDLRESGAIEQDADMVMFLYRTDYQKEDHQVDPLLKGDTYIKIAKHRNGQLDTLLLKAKLSVQKFEDGATLAEQSAVESYNERHPNTELFDTEQPF
ncbi:MAG TPA: DnaB-like helicase C-terminal domain-containing protein, partial [Chitinophaga sp.]|nr:DnaB-like helicase C-terminal domain-containing protein [Chitinophaga sp.]